MLLILSFKYFVQQRRHMAYEYCCSLGMRMAEFVDYQDLQSVRPGNKHVCFQWSLRFLAKYNAIKNSGKIYWTFSNTTVITNDRSIFSDQRRRLFFYQRHVP
jgi:hypothetical protein